MEELSRIGGTFDEIVDLMGYLLETLELDGLADPYQKEEEIRTYAAHAHQLVEQWEKDRS